VRRALGLALVLVGCATPDLPAPQEVAREAPEDSDPLAVVPGDTEVLAIFDLAALRASPWTRSVLVAGSEGARQRGFDQVNDVDALMLVRLPGDTAGTSLSVARGRFERARVRAAFAEGRTLSVASFRGCPLWSAGDDAVAFLTDRTLLSGSLASVRAAIDAAFGKARDIRGEAWLAELRKRFGKNLPPAAIEVVVKVSDPMREKLRAELVEAEGLERLAARVELGRRLDIAVVGTTGTREQASALIDELGATLRELQGRPSIEALGFARLLAGVQLAVQGPRVAAELRLEDSARADLAQRLAVVARWLSQPRAAGN
jgi:hypothetical protein